MWDNRQTWHFAVNDYQGQRRVMHRILLAGAKPIPASS
jgi:taurine dioxygenase